MELDEEESERIREVSRLIFGLTKSGAKKAYTCADGGEMAIRHNLAIKGSARVTLSGAKSDATIPDGSLLCFVDAESGSIRYNLNADATSTSPGRVPQDQQRLIFLTDVTQLSFYGPATTYANVWFYG